MRRRRFASSPLALFMLSGVPFGARFNNGGEGGGGGGGGDDEVTKRINEAVEKATATLKQNRDEILAEKRKLKESLDAIQGQIDALGGTDGLKGLIEMRERLSKDETNKLLAEGKHDEWFERRASAMRKDLEAKIKAATEKAEAAERDRNAAHTAYAQREIEATVMQAATKAGIVDTALDDVLLRARNTFAFDREHGVHIKGPDGVVLLGKDGKSPMGAAEWLDGMKEKARHWFPGSRGAGAEGGMGGGNGALSDAQVAKMSMSEYKEYRKKQGLQTGWAGRFNP
jgi:hypothetical protein